MSSIQIKNATAITMDEQNSIIHEATIAIADDKIIFAGPAAAAPVPGGDTEIIDGTRMVAIPGLVNAHTHLAMTLFRGAADDLPLMSWLTEHVWPVEARITEADVYWGSLLGVAEMLRAGVTSFQDMYWHVPATARAVRESGIRACLSGPIIGTMPGSEDAAACATEHIRAINGEKHPRLSACFGPHAPYTVPPAILTQIIDAAGELGVRVNIHLSETSGEVAGHRKQYGATPVAHLHQLGLFNVPVTAAHCVHITPEEIGILAENNVSVVHCP
ncbi:MAG: amidohydrolase family protein, partial [bacterium]